jgi:hypothetical protein
MFCRRADSVDRGLTEDSRRLDARIDAATTEIEAAIQDAG